MMCVARAMYDTSFPLPDFSSCTTWNYINRSYIVQSNQGFLVFLKRLFLVTLCKISINSCYVLHHEDPPAIDLRLKNATVIGTFCLRRRSGNRLVMKKKPSSNWAGGIQRFLYVRYYYIRSCSVSTVCSYWSTERPRSYQWPILRSHVSTHNRIFFFFKIIFVI